MVHVWKELGQFCLDCAETWQRCQRIKKSKYCQVSCQTYSRSNNWCLSMVHPLDFACRVSVDCSANKLKWKYKNNCKTFSSANMISINSPWNWVGAQSRPLLVNHVRRGCMQQTRSCCSLNLREKCCILTGEGENKGGCCSKPEKCTTGATQKINIPHVSVSPLVWVWVCVCRRV